ncbi:hypothetical protein [Streptomyces sp. NPDC054786]
MGRPARLHLEAETGLGRGGASAGDWPTLLDTAARADGGEPGAQGWARAVHTVAHEIVSRIGARVPRAYTGDTALDAR